MWILILTLMYNGGGVHIEHINFATRTACVGAANAWEERILSNNPSAHDTLARAICVEND